MLHVPIGDEVTVTTYDDSGRSVSSTVRSFAIGSIAAKANAYEPQAIYGTRGLLRAKSAADDEGTGLEGIVTEYNVRDVISMLRRHDLNVWEYVIGQYDPYSWEYKMLRRAYKRAVKVENRSKRELLVEDRIAATVAVELGVELQTSFESSLAVKLNMFEIPFSTHAKHFHVRIDGAEYTFSPDFYIPVVYQGRQVLAEVHAMNYFTPTYLQILSEFMNSQASKEYHLTLVTNTRPKKKNKLKIMMRKYGYEEGDICDKLIYIKYNPVEHREIDLKDESGSVYNYLSALRERSRSQMPSAYYHE